MFLTSGNSLSASNGLVSDCDFKRVLLSRLALCGIRYNARKPTQSIKAHQKRVFKAEWHYSQPLLISISSDLNIGLHKIS